MRMSTETCRDLEAACIGVLMTKPDARQAYREGRFPRADRVKDLDARFRWDLFHTVLRRNRRLREVIESEDLNDSHIYTALKRIIPPLSERHFTECY